MLCPCGRRLIRCVVLVQPRKTGNRPNMTGKLLTVSYFQPIMVAIFVTIPKIKVKLIPDKYTWAIVLIN